MTSNNISAPPRLNALKRTGLMDSAPEPEFDRVTRLVCHLLDADVSLISLVDDRRQFFKSSCGVPEDVWFSHGTPLSHSFCQTVVANEQTLVISDAPRHEAFANHPAVSELGVVAYLGVPLRSRDGEVLGSLCAICHTPRQWSADNQRALADFGAFVEETIWLRETADSALTVARQNELLAGEYNHRAKNILSIAQALVRLSSREATSVAALTDDLTDRLHALAQAHSMIDQADNLDLRTLFERLLAPYRNDQNPVQISGPTARLHRSQLTPMCLIIHELATNSAKYGAIKLQCALAIDWRIDVDDFNLVWTEFGEVSERPASCDGFGGTVLRAAARQLGGDFSNRWDGPNFVVRLTFPARLMSSTVELSQ